MNGRRALRRIQPPFKTGLSVSFPARRKFPLHRWHSQYCQQLLNIKRHVGTLCGPTNVQSWAKKTQKHFTAQSLLLISGIQIQQFPTPLFITALRDVDALRMPKQQPNTTNCMKLNTLLIPALSAAFAASLTPALPPKLPPRFSPRSLRKTPPLVSP